MAPRKPKPIDQLSPAQAETTSALMRDLRKQMSEVSSETAAFLVNVYYQSQHARIQNNNREAALVKDGHTHLEHVRLLSAINGNLEDEVKLWLDTYSLSTGPGRWLRSQIGIGPVIAAGLLAYLDITKAQYVSSFWQFAGLAPGQRKKAGVKINYNPQLKTLCFKLGESFIKVSNNPNSIYGAIYQQRKNYEWGKNLRGEYASTIGTLGYAFDKETESYKWTTGKFKGYRETSLGLAGVPAEGESEGVKMLPPMSITKRAARYAVKRLLSDLWVVMYKDHYKTDTVPSLPWVNTHTEHHDYKPPDETVAEEFFQD